MSTSLIIDLDDTKDMGDNVETLRQPTDLSTYRSQSNNKDIEMYNGILHSKISSCLLTLIKDRIKTYHGEKHERIQGLDPYKDISRGALQDTTLA